MKVLTTTINMREDIYNHLAFLSKTTGLKKREILLFVIRKTRKNKILMEQFKKNAEYQEKYVAWKKFHIEFDEVEREITMDMRKIFKLSLSLIVALAIEKYGHLILEIEQGKVEHFYNKFMDSYTDNLYLYYSNESSGSKIITIFWFQDQKKQRE